MRKLINFKFVFRILAAVLLFTATISCTVSAEPYKSYTYDYWLKAVPTPHAYLPERSIYGENLGIGEFKNASDIFVDKNNTVYILDTGNNRIICMNSSFQLVRVIDKFSNNGKNDTLKGPQGMFVSEDGFIYIADTQNQRIIKLDKSGNFIKEYTRPDTDLISQKQQYNPTKLVVDKGGRIYIIASGINKGLVEIDQSGKFISFIGANKVTVNPVEYLWKLFSTKEQRARMELFVPTEYTNVCINSEGFIYATTSTVDRSTLTKGATPVRKLDPKGVDVLRRYGYGPPVGDYVTGMMDDMSKLVDVTVDNAAGLYSVLDQTRGRVFTYDSDGNLLYIFGGTGYEEGNFDAPTAIETLGDKILVLDGTRNCVDVFNTTAYGSSVREAVKLHYQGKYEEAAKMWQKVLDYNANSDLAYIGLGRVLVRDKKYYDAMKYFKLANNRNYYSKAFKLYRKEFIGDHFGVIATGAIIVIGSLIVLSKVRQRKKYMNSEGGIDI